MTLAPYAELAAISNFSFLRGASHADEIVHQAKVLGLAAIGLADRNTLAGMVRAHVAAKEAGIRLVVGVRLVLEDGLEVLAYPEDRAAYARLTKLLTLGNRRAPKGECHLGVADLLAAGEGQCFLLMPPPVLAGAEGARFAELATPLAESFPGQVWLALVPRYRSDEAERLQETADVAARLGVPLLATNDVAYHVPERKLLKDVVTCIREHCRLEEAGFRLEANAERHLKSGAEMARLLAAFPDALAAPAEIVRRCAFSLDEIAYEYPDDSFSTTETPQAYLERLTWEGAAGRYPDGMPDKVRTALVHELKLIGELDYAPYFLTVYDIVRFARSKGILCQGRGSAANSAVCYMLGITSVDPAKIDLLFERFVSAERREPPDIDVDFEHERREEVIQYIYEKYGRHRAGLAATVVSYRARSAVREVGKVFGFSEDVVGALARSVWGWSSTGVSDREAAEVGLDIRDQRLRMVLALAQELIGFPRHLSQHVGGFVIARTALEELVPIQNAAMEDRTIVEWDKDDLDRLGLLKIDVLALGMLSCIRRAFGFLERHYNLPLGLADLPAEDPKVYDMLCEADSVGVFQVESRAQMTMLPRLKPRNFYDLVVEVAIVRPGPIQGDMVHPYLRRRDGIEPVDFPSEELREVLGKTMGVPLFQEQAMRIAIVAAGFPPADADRLRRAMATFRKTGTIHTFTERFVEGMVARGYERDFAERCFKQIEGFGEYGFPESHAASFALLVDVSAWIKCHYPDVFCAAILNAQPMGFYAPAQLVRDAREHGVEVRPVDVNASDWDCTLEPVGGGRHAVRLGFRQVKGFREDAGRTIEAARGRGFDSVRHMWLATDLSPHHLERLAEADAFRSIGLDRRAAHWAVRGLGGYGGKSPESRRGKTPAALPLFEALEEGGFQREEEAHLPSMPLGEEVILDYRTVRLSLKAHPISFLREAFAARGWKPCSALAEVEDGARIRLAGLVLVRQRPGTASGVIFATLEDESGIANVIVWPKVFERFRRIVLTSKVLAVTGRVQKEGKVIHVVAERLEDLTGELAAVSEAEIGEDAVSRADEVRKPGRDPREAALMRETERKQRIEGVLPRSRDFH